jgi:hypothetical protein
MDASDKDHGGHSRERSRGRRLAFPAFPLLAVLLIAGLGAGDPVQAKGRGDEPGDLILLWNGLKINAEYAAILVAPGSDQTLSFIGRDRALDVAVEECKGAGSCRGRGGSAYFTAPDMPGVYWLEVRLGLGAWPNSPLKKGGKSGNAGQDRDLEIACLVGYPSAMLRSGYLNDFELGEYPDPSDKQNPRLYEPPAYFYYLDGSVLGRYISEDIRLGDLGYDGRAPLPQYFALDYELVKKLEVLKDELTRLGLPSRYHFIGGGFISPKSNVERTSRNSAAANNSRHMWGEAVDFIIDESPRDEIMDDMNQDGRVDVRDALLVRDIVTELEESGRVKPGGFGVYAPPRNSQIQMHVDVRGFPTRWGVKAWDPDEFAGAPAKKSLRPGGKR